MPEPQTEASVSPTVPPGGAKGGCSNTGETVTGAARLALDLAESLSEGVPFLPGAVKALKPVVEAYEVRFLVMGTLPNPIVHLWLTSCTPTLLACAFGVLQKYGSNRESMDTLRRHIDSMNSMIKSVIPEGKSCPPKLEEQLRVFSQYVSVFCHHFGAVSLR